MPDTREADPAKWTDNDSIDCGGVMRSTGMAGARATRSRPSAAMLIRARRGSSRWLMKRPVESTSIQRRSLIKPAAVTSADVSAQPRIPLMG